MATALLLAIGSPAIARDRLAADAPYCARPGTQPVFLSPMGEPFRGVTGQPYPSALWFAQADRDHDGRIDRSEMIADAQRFFRILDRDRDGKLTPEEVQAYENQIAPEIALYSVRGQEFAPPSGRGGLLSAVLPRSGGSDYYGPMGAGAYAWLNIPEPVVAADSDVDRIITEQEFLSAAGRRFEQLDVAGTGSLALKTMPKTPNQQSIEGPCRPRPKPRTTGPKQRENGLREEESDAGAPSR